MAKIIDITEKLDFESNPKLIIKEKNIEINADAATVLKIMGIIGDTQEVSPKAVLSMYNELFTEKSRKELDKLKLSFKDLTTTVQYALNLVIGEEESEGEQ